MAVPDFSKIWASQSSLNPYEFSDEDYLDGWEFIGEIPPDRRVLDTWQRQADTKMQWLKNNMLGYLLRQNSHAYEVGDIAFSASLPSYLVLECTTAGTTAATEPDFSGAEVGQTVTDGEATWLYRDLLGGDMPLGTVHPFLQTFIPDGWLSLENGQLVLRSAYPELWAWVQDNAPLITEAQWQTKAAAQKSVGYYSDGDGSTTFRLPRIIGFVEGVTAANVGAFTGAGLPDITGRTAGVNIVGADGAFQLVSAMTAGGISPAQSGSFYVSNFDASRSNPIYGNSDTVQPESVGMVWCVRAFGAAVNQGTVDITALAQMLNLKADLDLSNVNATGLAKLVGSVSKAANGYLQLENGLIVQWGYNLITAAGTPQYITLPIEFPTAIANVVVCAGTTGFATLIDILNYKNQFAAATSSANCNCHWVAVGY